MPLVAGTRLGPYEILAPLGAGGMGEVYRARDSRLGREVAIKVLPERVAADSEAQARFEREARAVALLSHPNILAIHDVGFESGMRYSVTELLEGRTLRVLLDEGPMPARKAIDCAAQIARGLAAAHDKGVVHRDLKPENLFIGAGGQVKILDFGLARVVPEALGDLSTTPTLAEGTCPGTILGTIGYMSPEQVRARPADYRSDLFALGAILHEMLSGRRTFMRDSAADTMSAILKEDPPPLAASPEITPALQRLVLHCLEKSPAERFQSARDLAFHLEALGAASGASSQAVGIEDRAARPGRPAWSPRSLAAGLFGGAILGVALGAMVLPRLRPGLPPGIPTLRQLTYAGSDDQPSASPDGRLIAYASTRDGRAQIWLKQFPGGNEVALTSGPADGAPRISPDGSQVLFTRSGGAAPGLYRVPVVGGEPRKVLDDAVEGDWSPDGTRIAFLRISTRDNALLNIIGSVESAGLSEREIARIENASLWGLRWSPDGRTIAVVRRGGENSPSDLLLADVEARTTRILEPPPPRGMLSNPAWLADGRSIAYSQSESFVQIAAESTGGRILVQEIDSGRAEARMWLPTAAGSLDVLASGTVVMGVRSIRQNLKELSLAPGGAAASGASRWLTRGGSMNRQPILSPDGAWVLFTSNRGGSLDLWKLAVETGVTHRVTEDPADDWDPAFTPDGWTILWSSNRGGHFEIWACDADGTGARQVTSDGVDAENPTATPDGRWIVYNSSNPAHPGIWRIRPDGTAGSLVLPGAWSIPDLAPDGRHIAFRSRTVPTRVQVIRLEDGKVTGEPIELASGNPAGRARWMPDGEAVVFTEIDPAGVVGLMVRPFSPSGWGSSPMQPLRPFDASEPIESFTIARDGARAVVSILDDSHSLMLAQGLDGIMPPVRKLR